MLKELSIRNFAIIDDLHIDFSDGLTILSGETGAGKSIILKAVNLLLGSRASAELVRTGADSAGATLEAQWRTNMANPPETRIRAWRNQRLMQLKNEEVSAVSRDLPLIVRRELAQLAWMVARDQRRLRALGEFVRLAPRALRRRRST